MGGIPGSIGAELFQAARRSDVEVGLGAGLPAGTVLDERFELEGVTAFGATSVVHRAIDRTDGRTVAVKEVPLGAVVDVADEAAALVALDHPAIPRVLALGRQETGAYLVTEWVEGVALAGRERPGPARSIEIARAVAGALDHAHRRGVVHLDASPGNVLVGADRRVHLVDFGLARLMVRAAPAVRLRAVLGTPEFLAPEQAGGGDRLGPAVDVHGLGGLLQWLLSGRPPNPVADLDGYRRDLSLFLAGEALDAWPDLPVLQAAVGVGPVALASVPEFDAELEAIVHRALAPDPADRHDGPSAFAAALVAYEAGRAAAAGECLVVRGPGRPAQTVALDRPSLAIGRTGDLAIEGIEHDRAVEIVDAGGHRMAIPFDGALEVEGDSLATPLDLVHGTSFRVGPVEFVFVRGPR